MTHTEGVGWDVRLLREVEEWVLALDDDSYEQVAAAVDKLEHDGPTLGRPLVDRIEGSRHHNMKELRPGSAGRSEVRILFHLRSRTQSSASGRRRQGRQLEEVVRPQHPGRRREVRRMATRRAAPVKPATAKTWREVRAARPLDENRVAEHRARMDAEVRAYRLREVREEQGLTQVELAERMHVTQPTVSQLEGGEIDRTGLSTIKAYVEALGGTVEVVADFGDRRVVLG